MDMLLNLNDTISYIQESKLTRPITQIHIHNTFKPNHDDFTGNNHLKLQSNMRDYHVNANKWRDIGQHFTLFPDGRFVTGRSLDIDPASILGWNEGAICLEMLGDFSGRDPFQGIQAESAFRIVAAIVKCFGLPWNAVKFHRDNPDSGNKTCPGTSIDKDWFITECKARYNVMYPPTHWAQKDHDELRSAGILLSDHSAMLDQPASEGMVIALINRLRKG
jgi:hypothetical protein